MHLDCILNLQPRHIQIPAIQVTTVSHGGFWLLEISSAEGNICPLNQDRCQKLLWGKSDLSHIISWCKSVLSEDQTWEVWSYLGSQFHSHPSWAWSTLLPAPITNLFCSPALPFHSTCSLLPLGPLRGLFVPAGLHGSTGAWEAISCFETAIKWSLPVPH